MRLPRHPLARQALPDRPGSAAGELPRVSPDSASMQRVLDLLINERCNVLATSQSGTRLAPCGRPIASILRSRSDLAFEVYMPATADSMVARFNAATASLSLKSARTDSRSAAPLRILLVADTQDLLASEGQLFAKLVADFPAAGLRLLVLGDTGADGTSQFVSEIFGRRIRHVSLDAPVVEATTVRAPDSRPPVRVGDRSVNVAAALPDPSRRRHRVFVGSLAVISLALVSALIVVLVHRDRTPGGVSRTGSQLTHRPGSAVPSIASGAPAAVKNPSARATDPLVRGQTP